MVFDSDIERAAELLTRGKLVAFPTETVYGLGADASNAEALAELYRVKGRPTTHPVIVHLADFGMIHQWASRVPEEARLLAEKFWPGPMTLILPRAAHVLDQVTGGQDSVGLRIPGHKLALELLSAFAGGVAAPSANRFGRLSPTTAAAVKAGLGEDVSLVLDGGPCRVGIESTIISLLDSPTILRPGMISREEVEAVIGPVENKNAAAQPRVPGALASHYAPVTTLVVLPSCALLERTFGAAGIVAFRDTLAKLPAVENDVLVEAPAEPDDFARMIYEELRRLDAMGLSLIVVESPPQGDRWTGVVDRLSRASLK